MTDRSKEATGAPLSQSEETGETLDLTVLDWAIAEARQRASDRVALTPPDAVGSEMYDQGATRLERLRTALQAAPTQRGDDYERIAIRLSREMEHAPTGANGPVDVRLSWSDASALLRLLRTPAPSPASGPPAEVSFPAALLLIRNFDVATVAIAEHLAKHRGEPANAKWERLTDAYSKAHRELLAALLSVAEPPASGGQEGDATEERCPKCGGYDGLHALRNCPGRMETVVRSPLEDRVRTRLREWVAMAVCGEVQRGQSWENRTLLNDHHWALADRILDHLAEAPGWRTAAPASVGWRPERALADQILAELERARTKFPGDNVTMLALMEEVGELAKATFEESRERVRKEAVQVATMAMRVVLDGDSTLDAWRAAKGLDALLPPAPGSQQEGKP